MADDPRPTLKKVEHILHRTIARNEENFQKWMSAKGLTDDKEAPGIQQDDQGVLDEPAR